MKMIQQKGYMNNKATQIIKKKTSPNISNYLIKVLLKAIHQVFRFNRKKAFKKSKNW